MKKFFALCLALLMVLGVLSGCGETKPEPSETVETTTAPAKPVGTLYVSFGATLEIVYDEKGNSLEMTGTNETGKTIADARQDQVGEGCVFVLRSILRYAMDNDLMGDAKSITVRVGAEDALPTNEFLDEIVQDCQYLVDEELAAADMYCLSGDKLDDTGYLTYATAKELAEEYLGAEATGEEIPADGVFTFTAGEKTCTVDTFTGLVIGK